MPADLIATSRSLATARIISLISSYLSTHHLDLDSVALAARINVSSLPDPNVGVPIDSLLRLLEASANALDDDAFGVRLARGKRQELIPLLDYIALNSPTIADALKARIRYFRLTTDSFHIDYIECGEGARYCWRFPAELQPRRQMAGYVTALLVERVRSLTGCDWQPLEVTFEHGEPRGVAAYREALCSNLIFRRQMTSILIDKETLSIPIIGADCDLLNELQAYACFLLGLKRRSGHSFPEIVGDLIAQRIGTDRASEQEIAQSLGITVRHMQRELSQHETSFRQIVEQTRMEMARHFLTNTGMPLTEVALTLGFSELSSFSRAAKQWFGSSPTDIRKLQKVAQQ